MFVACIFALLAAALHVFIWYLESFAWTTRATTVFGHTPEEGESTRELAFNMGFYNLFLAIAAAAGAIAVLAGARAVGAGLMLAGVGSMTAAALLLFVTSPNKRGTAVKQGVLPLLSLIALLMAW